MTLTGCGRVPDCISRIRHNHTTVLGVSLKNLLNVRIRQHHRGHLCRIVALFALGVNGLRNVAWVVTGTKIDTCTSTGVWAAIVNARTVGVDVMGGGCGGGCR